MSTIKRFFHPMSGTSHDYVEGGTLEGHEVIMIYSKGVWHTVGTKEFDELVQHGIIELVGKEEL